MMANEPIYNTVPNMTGAEERELTRGFVREAEAAAAMTAAAAEEAAADN